MNITYKNITISAKKVRGVYCEAYVLYTDKKFNELDQLIKQLEAKRLKLEGPQTTIPPWTV